MIRTFFGRLLVGAAAVAIAPAFLYSQPARTNVARKPEVTRIKFNGVKAVNKSELVINVATDASHCRSTLLNPVCWITKSHYVFERMYLDRSELSRDMLRIRVFYWKRGFRDTQVDTIVAPSGHDKVAVTFNIVEGPPTLVTKLEVIQDSPVLAKREIERRVVLGEKTPFNLLRLDSTRSFLQQGLWDKGYADAVVDTTIALNEDAHTAAITITMHPKWRATIADIEIVGENRVAEKTIRKSLTFKAGDLYKRTELLRSQRALYESNLFKRAILDVPKQGDSNKVVVVTLEESPPRESRASLGFNTVDFFQVEGRFQHNNFMGGARRLSVSGALGNLFAGSLNGRGVFRNVASNVGSDRARYFAPTYNASIELRQPWFGSSQNAAAVSLFTHRRSAPGIFVDRGYGTSLTFTRFVTYRAPASANYRFELTRVEAGDVYFCVNYGVCDRPTLRALREQQRLSPLGLTAQMDRTNDPFEPMRGFRATFDAEHASSFTASDFRYNRATAEGSLFKQVRSRGVIGGHLRLGWVNGLQSTGIAVGTGQDGDILHPRKRFYAGGSRSVRGYGENQLGPRVLTIPASKLQAEDSLNPACKLATDITRCNPNVVGLDNGDFSPRPLGGNVVVEGSAELRFPLWGDFLGAGFVDAGMVSQRINPTLPRSKTAVTPGVGIRYLTRVGPVRVDFGVNPGRSETLPVVTERTVNGETTLVTLRDQRRFSGTNGVLKRLTLHLSIGEAF